MEILKGFVTAFRTLSIIPVPGKDANKFSAALYSFVFVGLALGSIQYGMIYGFYQLIGGQWPEVVAVAVVIMGILLTRGMHLDGLADFADGFWGGYDRQKTLAIMKDSFLGTFGVLAIVSILLAKWVSLVRLFELAGFEWIIASYLISRAMMVDLIVSLPYAREQGTAGPFIEGAALRHRIFAIIITGILLYLINGIYGVALLSISWAITQIYGWWCIKRVQGITGDLLGACSELLETFVMILAVILIIVETLYF